MDENEILRALSLQGAEREEALAAIALGETEYNINNNVREGYCGKFMFQFAGQTCPMHHHRVKHETFFLVKGRVRMTLDGRTRILVQGDRQVVDQNVRHEFTALEDSLILESSKPDLVEDSIFDHPKINRIISGG